MLNNLDLIKSIRGIGDHKFDLSKLTNSTSVENFSISQLF